MSDSSLALPYFINNPSSTASELSLEHPLFMRGRFYTTELYPESKDFI